MTLICAPHCGQKRYSRPTSSGKSALHWGHDRDMVFVALMLSVMGSGSYDFGFQIESHHNLGIANTPLLQQLIRVSYY